MDAVLEIFERILFLGPILSGAYLIGVVVWLVVLYRESEGDPRLAITCVLAAAFWPLIVILLVLSMEDR